MSHAYTWVQWNRHKRVYDALLWTGVASYLAGFMIVGKLVWRDEHAISDEVLVLRALGTCALLLLHVILCVGPLCRLDRRFQPLLYNRRHMGVTMFVVAAAHGLLSLGYYHGFGVVNPVVSLLTANTRYTSLHAFPFEIPGAIALVILLLMAATSHDFWLANLGPRVWKGLHMLVYVAYGLLIMHVALGALQAERSVMYPLLLGTGVVIVAGLHVIAGTRSHAPHRDVHRLGPEWIDICSVDEIPEGRAKKVTFREAERVAVFRYDGKVSALTDLCAHQHGPLSEGKIVGGCVTCPWHGYQYQPHNGQSPPPFTERIVTYRVRVENGRVWLNPTPLPPGTEVAPGIIGGEGASVAVS